jgi:hypothetical protein
MGDVNSVSRFRRQFAHAAADGKVTRAEARRLSREVRAGGITGHEQQAVRSTVDRNSDLFERGAGRTLRDSVFIGDYNSTALVRNQIKVALADDGRIDAREAHDIVGGTNQTGFTHAEQHALAEELRRHASQLGQRAERIVKRDVDFQPPPRTQPKTIHIDGIAVRTHGASRAAISGLRTEVSRMFRENPALARRLRDHHVTISIVPYDRKATDLPELARFAHTRTGTGTEVASENGVTVPTRHGAIVAIPEQNLAHLSTDVYNRHQSIAVHELGHAVEFDALPQKTRDRIASLFDARARSGGPFPTRYSRSNAHEYFAELSAAYFGQGSNSRDAGYLRRHDPEAYRLLRGIYGPPPSDNVA